MVRSWAPSPIRKNSLQQHHPVRWLIIEKVVLYRKRKEEGFKKLGDKAGEGKPGQMATSSGDSKADPSVLAVELAPA